MKGVCILDHGSYTKMPPSSGAPQLDSVFQQTQPMWERLAEHITGSPQAMGAAAKFEMAARVEAASRMIMNHEAVLRDICNPSSTQNVVGAPLTQVELTRVPAHNATQVDQMMREVCRRLLGQIPVQEEQKSDAKVRTHNRPLTALTLPLSHTLSLTLAQVWNAAAMFLLCRLQGSEPEKPGRSPDMSVRAAFAMKAVLHEVGAM